MIFTILLIIFNAFVTFVFSFLPIGHLPAAFSAAFAYFFSALQFIDFVLPVDAMATAASFVAIWYLTYYVAYFSLWVISLIRGN